MSTSALTFPIIVWILNSLTASSAGERQSSTPKFVTEILEAGVVLDGVESPHPINFYHVDVSQALCP